jgi:hypothetical protein
MQVLVHLLEEPIGEVCKLICIFLLVLVAGFTLLCVW